MKLGEIGEVLEAKIVEGADQLDRDILMGCGSDLMSDVLAFIKSDALLLTGLTNPQVIRTAEMAEVVCICFVRGKEPPSETVELAREKGISLLTTALPMFESCGRLREAGLPGCSERK
jgi:hypothetical protein